MAKENEVKERFAELYDEAKERIETLIENDMRDVDGVYLRYFGKKEVEVTISPSQKYFEYNGLTIWLSDGMEEGFKKNFKRLIEIYYNIRQLDLVEYNGEEYWVDIASQMSFLTPVFVRANGEVIEPKYNKEEDILYWTLLAETEVDEWIEYYQSAIEEEVEA